MEKDTQARPDYRPGHHPGCHLELVMTSSKTFKNSLAARLRGRWLGQAAMIFRLGLGEENER